MASLALTFNDMFDFPESTASASSVVQDAGGRDRVSRIRESRNADHSAFNTNIMIETTAQATIRSNLDQDRKGVTIGSIIQQIESIQTAGDDWNDEGIRGPNAQLIENSLDIAVELVENDFPPIHVTQTVEEGICFVFKNNERLLYMEMYNDGEIGLIVENYKDKKILSNKSLGSNGEILQQVNSFFFT